MKQFISIIGVVMI